LDSIFLLGDRKCTPASNKSLISIFVILFFSLRSVELAIGK